MKRWSFSRWVISRVAALDVFVPGAETCSLAIIMLSWWSLYVFLLKNVILAVYWSVQQSSMEVSLNLGAKMFGTLQVRTSMKPPFGNCNKVSRHEPQLWLQTAWAWAFFMKEGVTGQIFSIWRWKLSKHISMVCVLCRGVILTFLLFIPISWELLIPVSSTIT